MFYWIIKIFALLTCIALLLGLAAETTTLMGDAMSQNPRLERTDNPVGLMLKRQRQNNRNTRIPKCEAYAWNTDFPQRPGALFHGAFYHSLTILAFLAMLVHQGLRGITPNTLPSLYKFVPSLQGQWGLWGTGITMVYVGFQMMSYSIGKLHLITAGLLIFIGCMNFCAGFFLPIASANAAPPMPMLEAPYDPEPAYEPENDQMQRAPQAAAAPDPYEGGPTGAGVGAGAAPPGMFDKGVRTSGGIPSRFGARFNEDDDSDDDDKNQLVVDPRTGLWTKAGSLQQMSSNPYMPGMLPMPIGYDMYGRPVMAPPQYPNYMPGGAILGNDNNSKRSSRSMKKAIKRQARKEVEKMRRLDEEDEDDLTDDADRESTRSNRRHRREERSRIREDERKQQEYERQIREEEKRRQMLAKGIAISDAKLKAAQEIAQEDARMKNYKEILDNQRQLAMTDAQRKQFKDEMNLMREQQLLTLAERKAEIDAEEKARQDEEMYRRQAYQAQQYQAQQYQQTQQYQKPQYRGPQYPPAAVAPMRDSAVSGSRSLPPYTPYTGEGQQLHPPSYRGSSQRSAASFGYPPAAHQQQYREGNASRAPPNHVEAEEYDFDDDITEIQSVRSETSSQRRLVTRRLEEERERVIQAQERERSLTNGSRNAHYSENDILDDYRSEPSIRSANVSLRNRPRW